MSKSPLETWFQNELLSNWSPNNSCFCVGSNGASVWSCCPADLACTPCAGYCVGGISSPPWQRCPTEPLRWVILIILLYSSWASLEVLLIVIPPSSNCRPVGVLPAIPVLWDLSVWSASAAALVYVEHKCQTYWDRVVSLLCTNLCLPFSVCTPFGLSRMFSVTGSLLVKPRVSRASPQKSKPEPRTSVLSGL